MTEHSRASTKIALTRVPFHRHDSGGVLLVTRDEYGTPALSSTELTPPQKPEVHTNVATLEDVPPDGGYGWVCVFCVFMINACTWGVNSSWSIFLDRYNTGNIFPDATKFEYAMIGGLSVSQALLISPVSAACRREIGSRSTMLIGTALVFAGLFSSSAATEIWHLFMSFAFCFGWGMGMIYIPAMSLLPPWFSTHRSLAVGLATSGAGLGGLAYSLLAGRIIALSGTAWAWRILSFISLGVNGICSLLLRERPPSVASASSANTPGSRRYAFSFHSFFRIQIFLILAWGFLTEFGYVALTFSLPSYATSLNLTPTQGSIVQALLSLGLGIGRPVVGYYSDRVGRINMALCMTLACGILCLTLWILARSYVGLLVFAGMAGVVSGTFWSTINPVLAEVVGIAEAGSMFGAICFALVVPATFSEAIALQLVRGEGVNQFLPSQIFVGFMFLAGASFLWCLRSWKICEIERKAEDEQISVLTDMEVAGTAAMRGVRSSFWLSPRRLFMPRRV